MRIRSKLALLLSAGIAAACVAVGLAFFKLQSTALREAEAEKSRLLLESVQRMASEATLARDPLMLLDYLSFLRRERGEVHHCRVEIGGKWQELGGKEPPPPPGGLVHREVTAGRGRERLTVDIQLSSKTLAERQKRASEAMLRDLGRAGGIVALLGLLASFLLSGALTRRIETVEEAIEAIGRGKLGHVAPAKGSDEIARLGRGVNIMSEKLQELDKLKKTFVASVTHELRSPLGAIESHVRQMLSEPQGLTDDTKAALERIRRNASRLEHFVTNLLEMSRIERGKLDFMPRQGELGPLVTDAALFFEPRAKEAGLRIEAEVEKGLPPLRLDPDLISQVITNLVSNAIKFTRKGGLVKLTARKAVHQGGPGVECAVEDTGIGIPAEALERVFTPFERVRSTVKATGAGLGLAICKSIVEMHGGALGAASVPGKGSRFHFVLPLKGKG